jgi:hypothetical protein
MSTTGFASTTKHHCGTGDTFFCRPGPNLAAHHRGSLPRLSKKHLKSETSQRPNVSSQAELLGLYSQAEDHSLIQSREGRGAEGPVDESEGGEVGGPSQTGGARSHTASTMPPLKSRKLQFHLPATASADCGACRFSDNRCSPIWCSAVPKGSM